MDTVTLTIDGRQITVDNGETVLQDFSYTFGPDRSRMEFPRRDVNGYWMCDIGRFDCHWIEGDDRLRRPLERVDDAQQPVSWHEILSKLGDRIVAARTSNPHGVCVLLSAHASHEELSVFGRLTEAFFGKSTLGPPAISMSWRYQPKSQPEGTKFTVPPVDAPNVNGALMFGFVDGQVGDEFPQADVSVLRAAVDAGHVSALYVFDPGPKGSIGDVGSIINARSRGTLLLIVQGVLLTDLARATDFVLPRASYVEKEASYTNDQGPFREGPARFRCPARQWKTGRFWSVSPPRSACRTITRTPHTFAPTARRDMRM